MNQKDKPEIDALDSRSEEELLQLTAETEEEKAEMEQMLREIHGADRGTMPPKLRKIGYIVAFFSLSIIMALTWVLLHEFPYSTRVYGPSKVEPGGRANYRVAIYSHSDNDFWTDFRVRGTLLHPNGKKHLLFQGNSRGQAFSGNATFPSWKQGNYSLEVSIHHERGKASYQTSVQLQKQVLTQGKKTHKKTILWKSPKTKENPYLVRLMVGGRDLLADLPNWVHIQVHGNEIYSPEPKTDTNPQKTGQKQTTPTQKKQEQAKQVPTASATTNQGKKSQPVSGVQVFVEERGRKHGPFTTDKSGFIRFSYVPTFSRLAWKITMKKEGKEHTFPLILEAKGYEIALVSKKVHVAKNEKLTLRFESILKKGTFFFDFVQRGQRVWSQQVVYTGGTKTFEIKVPTFLSGLVTLQAYSEFYMPGEVYDTRFLYIGKTTPKKLQSRMFRYFKNAGEGKKKTELTKFFHDVKSDAVSELWLRRVFAFAKPHFHVPNLLLDTAKKQFKHMRNHKETFRKQSLFILALLAAFILLGACGTMVWGYVRDYRSIQSIAQEEEVVLKSRGIPYMLLSTFFLLLFFSAALYLFWIMQWGFEAFKP